MTRVPIMGFNPMPNPDLVARMPQAYISMGETAENVAQLHQVPRRAQEEFAAGQPPQGRRGAGGGPLQGRDRPIEAGGKTVDRDGCIRPDTTPDTLAGLKPAFREGGTVTAGTSSPLTTARLRDRLQRGVSRRRIGLEPLARIKSVAVAGCAPEIMGMGPEASSRKALSRAASRPRELDVVELNEAFASQAIACIRELGWTRRR
jgi:acetyl-CoA acyltransferase